MICEHKAISCNIQNSQNRQRCISLCSYEINPSSNMHLFQSIDTLVQQILIFRLQWEKLI